MSEKYKVLAIDPGFGRMGVAVLDSKSRMVNGPSTGSGQAKVSVLYSDCFETDAKLAFPARLGSLADKLRGVIIKWAPERVALEKLFFSANVKTAMQVAEVRGMVIALAQEYSLVLEEYSPQEVKVAITGSGRADKAQVANMVSKLVTLADTPKHDDEYDAIAIGICGLVSRKE